METKKQKNIKKELVPQTVKKAVIFVAGTTLALAFLYSVTYASSKILKNLEKMGV